MRRKPQLDALRAFAAMAVLVHHFLPVYKVIPEDFFTLGLLAVRLFFVLSGYLITGILLRSKKHEFWKAITRFYFRRSLRIFPIYYLGVLAAALGIATLRPHLIWHLLYASNFLAVIHPETPLWHLWTLSVEEQFYLIWPLLILLTPYRHVLKVIVAAIVAGIAWKALVAFTTGNILALAILTPGCLDSLGLGALLAFVEHDPTLKNYRLKFMNGSAVLGSSIVIIQTLGYATHRGTRYFWSTYYLGVSLIFVWLVARASDGFGGKSGKILEWKPLLYVGKISYGLYLYHFFLIPVGDYVAGLAFFPHPKTIFKFIFDCALTFAVSAASRHFIESPIEAWKDRMESPVSIPSDLGRDSQTVNILN